MNKKIVAVLSLVLIVAGALFFSNRPKDQLSSPLINQPKEIVPSETLIEYTDPAGFTFSYPDNLSLTPNELTDAAYAELQLFAKGVGGNLILKISDSKFANLDEWAKSIKDAEGISKEAKLGSLKALEVKTANGLKLASIDQGVIFSIDVSQNDFWMKVYSKVLADFSFAPPAQGDVGSSSDDVSFEGEEVVE